MTGGDGGGGGGLGNGGGGGDDGGGGARGVCTRRSTRETMGVVSTWMAPYWLLSCALAICGVGKAVARVATALSAASRVV